MGFLIFFFAWFFVVVVGFFAFLFGFGSFLGPIFLSDVFLINWKEFQHSLYLSPANFSWCFKLALPSFALYLMS